MKKVVVELPKNFPDASIEDFLREHVEDLYAAMDLEVQDLDDRATLDNVEIDDVTVQDGIVTVDYRVEYSAYHGCRDMNYDDDDDRCIAGERIGDRIEFDEHVAPPKRSTHEEF
jgi:hypothetical protein